MAETTGIPIIDRLDALLDDENVSGWDKEDAMREAFGPLRALVLRLQEERDEALQGLEEQRQELRAQNMDMFIAGLGEKAERGKAEQERDALLEALKGARGRLDFVVDGDDSPADPVTAAWGILNRAIANVEGKE